MEIYGYFEKKTREVGNISEDILAVFGSKVSEFYTKEGKLIGIIVFTEKDKNIIEINYIKILNIEERYKGYGSAILERFIIDLPEKTKIVIKKPLMKEKIFWFRIIRKLYIKGLIDNIQFERNPLRKNITQELSHSIEINHAFKNITFIKKGQ